jgi:hypothetical protein
VLLYQGKGLSQGPAQAEPLEQQRL